jgi:hypothetical protein
MSELSALLNRGRDRWRALRADGTLRDFTGEPRRGPRPNEPESPTTYGAGAKALLAELETKVRRVRDPGYWGKPYGTPIVPGMKPTGKQPPTALVERAVKPSGRAPTPKSPETVFEPDYRPGNWKPVSLQLIREHRAMVMTTARDDDSPRVTELARRQAEAQFPDGARVWLNGPHTIMVLPRKMRTDGVEHQVEEGDVLAVATHLDKLNAYASVEGKWNITIGLDEYLMNKGADADCVVGTGTINLRSNVVVNRDPAYAAMASATRNANDMTLSEAQRQIARERMVYLRKLYTGDAERLGRMPEQEGGNSYMEWVVTHEWGHASHTDSSVIGLSDAHRYDSDISRYGRTNMYEARAEMFAEWYLSDGQTLNEATKRYAKMQGWKPPSQGGMYGTGAKARVATRSTAPEPAAAPMRVREDQITAPKTPTPITKDEVRRIKEGRPPVRVEPVPESEIHRASVQSHRDALSARGQAAIDAQNAKYGLTQEALEAEILAGINAFPEDVEARLWYHAAHAFAQKLADRYGVTLSQAVAVIAAVSPRKEWGANRRQAEVILARWREFDDVKDPHEVAERLNLGLNTNVTLALRILRGDSVDILSESPKRPSFYNNIMWPGQTDDSTNDAWTALMAYRAATKPMTVEDTIKYLGSSKVSTAKSGAGYVAISEAVRAVAVRLGWTTEEVQAVYWTNVRKLDPNQKKPVVSGAADVPWPPAVQIMDEEGVQR